MSTEATLNNDVTVTITNTYPMPDSITVTINMTKTDAETGTAITNSDETKRAKYRLLKLTENFETAYENDPTSVSNAFKNSSSYSDAVLNSYISAIASADKTVGENGQVSFASASSEIPGGNIYPGDIFFFYEVQAPDGYKKDNSVTDGKLITIVKGTASYSVRYTDEPESMDVNLLKTDGSNPLAGAQFDLYFNESYNPPTNSINNGLSKSSGGKLTSPIEYSAGYIYKKSGSSTKHYEEKNTYTYTGRGDELCVKMNNSTLAKWDDLHITFYASGKNQILQGKDGYVMKYSGTDTSGNTYLSMPIPSNAAYFSLNNGIGKSDPHNLSLSGKYEILPLNASGDENTSQNFTKGNMVYTLNDSTLSKPLPEFTEDTSSSEVTLDAYPSPRGDYIYIKDVGGNTLTSPPPTFEFYNSSGSELTSPGVNTHAADGSDKWYSVGIPTDATEFTMNNGSTKYPIYQKTTETTTSDTSLNFTPGNMYYSATGNQTLSLIWPTFSNTSEATNYNDDNWSNNTKRSDALYLVCANKSDWDGMTVTFYDAGGTAIKNGSNTGTNRRVYFSIGDNTVEKEISCTDEMDAAYIRLFEHINEKKDSWSDPTFIFKITNTDTGKTNLVSLTVNDDGTIADTINHKVLKWIDDQGNDQFFAEDPINNMLYDDWLVEATSETEYKGMYHIDSQGRIKVEPGTYSITRVPVSRYEFVTSGNLVYTTDTEPTGTYIVNSSGTETAETVTLTAGQTGDIHYYDKVGYYDKFSQVDTEVNKFYKLENGANKTIKGIRIADYHSTATSGEIALTGSALTIYAIYADGTEGELNSTEKAKITFSYTDVDDEPAPFTPTLSSDNKTLTVSDVTAYTGNVYTITATYPYDSDTNFTAKFDLVFSRT